MTLPKDPYPRLASDRLARRRDHLMNEISAHTTTQTTPRHTDPVTDGPAEGAWWRRRPALIGVGAVIAVGGLGLGASAVAANGFMVTRQPGGMVAIDLDQATGVYQGRVVTLAEVANLNKNGEAMFSIANRELACQGVMLYFDTEAQADDYGRGYAKRETARRAVAASTSGDTGDPCQGYSDTPNFVPPGVKLGPVSPSVP